MSETKNLKLFKHDEPLETNENKFDIDLALNQNWDKIDKFADTVNDKVTKLQEQNTKLEAQIKKDRENMINLEVEGQSIHIEDSSDLEGQLEVLGNVEQDVNPSPENPSEIRAVGDKGSVEIRKQNENFFNKNNANILNAYIGASKGNIVSGTYHRTVYLKVNKGTYTITKHKGVPGFVLGYTKTEPKLGDIVENLVNAVGKTTETISVENGYLVINIYVTSDYNANYTVEDILNGLKIELGKVSTEYTEHQEQTKILPIQKPMLEGDYFNRVDNKEVHTWKKIILDGVNNKVTQMNTNQSGKWRYEYKSDNLKNCSLSEEKAYCTHLPLIRKGETADNIVGFTVVYNGIYIYTNGETAEEFNTKLQTNNITFYIPVIESAYQKLDLTSEQTEVLDELDNFPTYKPTTNITTDSIAKLKLKYIADTKTYVDNKVNNLEQQVNVINELLSTTKTSSVLLDNLQFDIESEVL